MPLKTTSVLALLLLPSLASAAFNVERATVYHRQSGGASGNGDTLVLGGSPGNTFTTSTGSVGATVNASSVSATFKMEALATKNPGPGYLELSTNGSLTFSSASPFNVSGFAVGRGAGSFTLLNTATSSETSYGFGFLFNQFSGQTTALAAGQYNLAWNVYSFTANGTGGPGSASFIVTVPEPVTLACSVAMLAGFLLRRR
jgi:hypothetical protein